MDFRQLIKVLADAFHVRIEMKQIGARQEAGRIGGTGPCGRELCCASWMKNFVSVSTNAARYQDISPNPQKLAGMCGKLKCCLNYEVDNYIESGKRLPSREVSLHTLEAEYFFFKMDILAGLVTYSTDKNMAANLETITAERARRIIEMNKRGEKPDNLTGTKERKQPERPKDLLADADISRFDKSKGRGNKGNNNGKPRNNQRNGQGNEGRRQGNRNGGRGQNRRNGAPQHSNENVKNNTPHSEQPTKQQQIEALCLFMLFLLHDIDILHVVQKKCCLSSLSTYFNCRVGAKRHYFVCYSSHKNKRTLFYWSGVAHHKRLSFHGIELSC